MSALLYSVLATPLIASGGGPVRMAEQGCRRPVFLAQGDLDGACGFYCVGMALLAFGVIERRHFRCRHRSTTPVGKFMAAMQHCFFGGLNVDELVDLVSLLTPLVRARLLPSTQRQLAVAISDALRAGRLVVARVEGQGGALNHWVLIVGMEVNRWRRPATTSAFLVLDPSEPPPTVSCWNARLELSVRARTRHRLIGMNGRSVAVRLEDAVALQANSR